MALCPRCGEDNPERARFCVACGTALAADLTAASESLKVVTVLFTDVSGSTALGERFDAEALRHVLNRFYTAARAAVEQHGGTIEKIIGDAVLAVFGVPQLHEDDALRAVRAAVAIREALAALNEELAGEYGVHLELRTGVSTGEVAVGAADAFALGSAVDAATRLEQAASPGEILISEPTRLLARDAVDVERVEAGGQAPIAWRLRGVVGDVPFVRRLETPLVGREPELDVLRTAYAQALASRACGLVTVLGPAGIGKSRLVRELVSSVEADASVLFGRCPPYGEGITYWPLADALRRAAAIDGELSAADSLGRIAALLGADDDAELIANRVAGAIGLGEATAALEEISWAVRRLLEALAARRALVVVFDDIHWAEATFLDLVEQLAARIDGVPMLLVCMARPELRETRPGWAAGLDRASALELGPLSDGESTRLIAQLEPAAQVDDALRGRIAAAAAGNPLFVEEMLAMLGDEDPSEDVVLPPTIQALLAARLDRLAPAERDVVGRASVIGQEFARRAVAELAEGRPVEAELQSLVRKELLRQEGDGADADGFQFRHLLIRDAAYASLPKVVRAELHERYARVLARAAGERLREVEELVGYHLEQAYAARTSLGPEDEAARSLAAEAALHLQAGGARAAARGDLPAAASLLRRALALLPADEPGRSGVQAFLGGTLLELGQLEPADQHLAEAEETARAAGIRPVELSARVARTLVRAQSDPAFDPAAAIATAEDAIPELEQAGADAALAGVWRMLMIARLIEHNPAALQAAAERALETASRLGHARGQAEALFWLSLALAIGPVPVEEALRRCERLLEQVPGPLGEAAVQTVTGWQRATLGDVDEGRRLVRLGRDGFRELGFVLYAESSAHAEAAVELHAGDLDAVERVLREGSATLAAVGETASLANQLGLLSWTLAHAGRTAEALELADRSRQVAAARVAQAYWRRGRSLALAAQGELESALPLAHEAVGVIAGTGDLHTHAELLENLAAVLEAAGRGDEASAALEQATGLYGQKGCLVCTARLTDRHSSIH